MPQELFYDYFWHALHCDPDGEVWINRLPKKLGSSMAAISTNGPELETHMDWGIQIIGGPRKMPLGLTFGVIITASLLVAVIYNARTGSHDTGMAIPFWILNALATSLPFLCSFLGNE